MDTVDLGSTMEGTTLTLNAAHENRSDWVFEFKSAIRSLGFAAKEVSSVFWGFNNLFPRASSHFIHPETKKAFQLRGSNRTKRLRKKQWKHLQTLLNDSKVQITYE